MLKHKSLLLGIFAIVLACLIPVNLTKADEQVTPKFTYQVEALLPENQINKDVTYFDLTVKPNTTQEFRLKLSNSGDTAIKLKIKPTTALTTQNGTIDYSGMDLPHTSNAPALFEEILSPEQEIDLPAKSSKEVKFEGKIPEKIFKGVILGGFYVQEVVKEEDSSATEQNGVKIKNRFSRIIGAVLRESEEKVSKEFSLGKTKLDTYGGFFSVIPTLENKAPAIVPSYRLEGKIENSKGESVMSFMKDKFSMAPNSAYKIPQQIKELDFEPGKYKLSMMVYSKDSKDSWKLTDDFEVKASEREKVLEQTIGYEKKNHTDYMPMIMIGLFVTALLVAVIVGLIWKMKQGKKK